MTNTIKPVTLAERWEHACAEYHRATAAKNENPTRANVLAFHKANALLLRLEKERAECEPVMQSAMSRQRTDVVGVAGPGLVGPPRPGGGIGR